MTCGMMTRIRSAQKGGLPAHAWRRRERAGARKQRWMVTGGMAAWPRASRHHRSRQAWCVGGCCVALCSKRPRRGTMCMLRRCACTRPCTHARLPGARGPHLQLAAHAQRAQQRLGGEDADGAAKEVLHTAPAHVRRVLRRHAVWEALQGARHATRRSSPAFVG